MQHRWVRRDGGFVRQTHQSKAEVGAVLDLNQHIRSSSTKPGGLGSENMRFLARVPAAADAQWTAEWRARGGYEALGMTAREFCILRASQPDYSEFVVTPSGKTGFERGARRLAFGYGGNATGGKLVESARQKLSFKRLAAPKPSAGLVLGGT